MRPIEKKSLLKHLTSTWGNSQLITYIWLHKILMQPNMRFK